MVPRRLYPWTVALLVVLGLRARLPRIAAPIKFTGYVTQDFNPATNPNVVVTPVSSNPLNIGQSAVDHRQRLGLGMEHPGHPDVLRCLDRHALRRHQHVRESPAAVRPVRPGQRRPDRHADRLRPCSSGRRQVDRPGHSPRSTRRNPSRRERRVVVAGVPADKTIAGTGTDGFTVSHLQRHARRPRQVWPTRSARACPSTRATWPSTPRRPILSWSSRSRTSARFPG